MHYTCIIHISIQWSPDKKTTNGISCLNSEQVTSATAFQYWNRVFFIARVVFIYGNIKTIKKLYICFTKGKVSILVYMVSSFSFLLSPLSQISYLAYWKTQLCKDYNKRGVFVCWQFLVMRDILQGYKYYALLCQLFVN